MKVLSWLIAIAGGLLIYLYILKPYLDDQADIIQAGKDAAAAGGVAEFFNSPLAP